MQRSTFLIVLQELSGTGHVAPTNLYAIGSRRLSLFRSSWLIVSAVGTLAILYLDILQLMFSAMGSQINVKIWLNEAEGLDRN